MSGPVALKVGLLGCGTVGGGVVRLVAQNADQLAARIGAPVEIRRVLVRDPARQRPDECPRELLTTDPEDVLGDPSIDIIVEVMGGLLVRHQARRPPHSPATAVAQATPPAHPTKARAVPAGALLRAHPPARRRGRHTAVEVEGSTSEEGAAAAGSPCP